MAKVDKGGGMAGRRIGPDQPARPTPSVIRDPTRPDTGLVKYPYVVTL